MDGISFDAEKLAGAIFGSRAFGRWKQDLDADVAANTVMIAGLVGEAATKHAALESAAGETRELIRDMQEAHERLALAQDEHLTRLDENFARMDEFDSQQGRKLERLFSEQAQVQEAWDAELGDADAARRALGDKIGALEQQRFVDLETQKRASDVAHESLACGLAEKMERGLAGKTEEMDRLLAALGERIEQNETTLHGLASGLSGKLNLFREAAEAAGTAAVSSYEMVQKDLQQRLDTVAGGLEARLELLRATHENELAEIGLSVAAAQAEFQSKLDISSGVVGTKLQALVSLHNTNSAEYQTMRAEVQQTQMDLQNQGQAIESLQTELQTAGIASAADWSKQRAWGLRTNDELTALRQQQKDAATAQFQAQNASAELARSQQADITALLAASKAVISRSATLQGQLGALQRDLEAVQEAQLSAAAKSIAQNQDTRKNVQDVEAEVAALGANVAAQIGLIEQQMASQATDMEGIMGRYEQEVAHMVTKSLATARLANLAHKRIGELQQEESSLRLSGAAVPVVQKATAALLTADTAHAKVEGLREELDDVRCDLGDVRQTGDKRDQAADERTMQLVEASLQASLSPLKERMALLNVLVERLMGGGRDSQTPEKQKASMAWEEVILLTEGIHENSSASDSELDFGGAYSHLQDGGSVVPPPLPTSLVPHSSRDGGR